MYVVTFQASDRVLVPGYMPSTFSGLEIQPNRIKRVKLRAGLFALIYRREVNVLPIVHHVSTR
jgi:hypothetical protein